ncbi:MAG: hypothetical protein QOC96_1361 [Acidobacteriota bacterium]|jgi:hypothetical protein|nr:hypothetical protein [Acidobacteriota bacterium]
MPMILKMSERAQHRPSERGVALVSTLLISLLLLSAGGALILTTAMTATNAMDSTAEMKAYYAAQAGLQATLNVFRGNVAPNPLIDPSSPSAVANKITFRSAVTASTSNISGDANGPRLSRWLTYDSTYTDRVVMTSPYSPLNGLAYSTTISDPDNSAVVTFSTSGLFNNSSTTKQFGSGNAKATLTYTPQASTTINSSGNSTLGYFTISSVGGQGYTLTNEPFSLTITQTAPWLITATISCTLSGTFTGASTDRVVVSFPTLTDNLGGAVYARTINPALSNGSANAIVTSVTAPQPNRLLVKVNGYGPRAAKKQMQMLLSRFTFDYTPVSTITLRSADDNTVLNFNAGNSAAYGYNGNDNAGGSNLPAFAVTSTPDYTYLNGLGLPAGQIVGNPAGYQQISISSLPIWLQTADAARALISQMRIEAQNVNRYYTTASQPPGFGTTSQPLLTFVDGDTDLPPAGGAGLLIVTGTLTLNGSSQFDGLILVLGTGQLIRTGGGNGNSLGSVAIASFGASGNFLAPTFNSNGSGTSSVQYDSDWVRRALASTGPRVLGVSEY